MMIAALRQRRSCSSTSATGPAAGRVQFVDMDGIVISICETALVIRQHDEAVLQVLIFSAFVSDPEQLLIIDRDCHGSFRIAFWISGERQSFSPHWSIACRRLPVGSIVAIRLGERNPSVFDYIVLPLTATTAIYSGSARSGRVDHAIRYYKTESELACAVARLSTSGSCASRTRLKSRTKATIPVASKRKSAGARHRLTANKDTRRSPHRSCD
jgi:hypothetical protein